MTYPYENRERVERILVLRALQLGDLLCAAPAFRALRRAFPDAEIALIGLPWSRLFVERFSSLIDEFIEFPGYYGLPEREIDHASLPRFLDAMAERNVDLVVQLQGAGTYVNEFIGAFRARSYIGFAPRDGYRPSPGSFIEYRDEGHEVERLLRPLEAAGIPRVGTELEYPLFEEDWAKYSALVERRRLDESRLVLVHPGARADDRRWPTERFAAVADKLAERGFQVALTGSEAERPLIESVKGFMGRPVVDLSGATDLGTIGCLLKRCRLLVANCTGVSHIACGVRARSVVIFTGSDPERWAPLDASLHTALRGKPMPTVDEVVGEAGRLLRGELSYAA